MESVRETAKKILESIANEMDAVKDAEIGDFLRLLLNSRNVYVAGAGRTGLAAKAFAMRLMHVELNVYVVGETITPSIKPGDLLIAMSGSGKTSSVLIVAETAKKMGVKVAAITSFRDSPLAKLADCIVVIGGRRMGGNEDYTKRQLTGEHEPLTPLGTLFELSLNIFLDSVISELMKIFRKGEQELKRKHSNLE